MDLQIEIMDSIKLEQGKTYLFKYGSSHTLSSVTVLMVSEKGYYLRWNSGLNSSESWELKTHIDNNYWLIEDITDLIDNNKNRVNTEYYNIVAKAVQCRVCNGMGVVPDKDSTAGTKLCPCCLGGKMVIG